MRAVFLDRDGVLNTNRSDYVKSWAEFEWLPGAIEALRMLARDEAPIIVVTNQSAVGRGLMPGALLDDIHDQMRREAQANGGRIDAVYACRHTPADTCHCRKPQPGLLLTAAQHYHLDLAASVLIGDSLTDFQAARSAGLRYVHVRSGRGASEAAGVVAADETVPIVDDLRAAVALDATALARQAVSAA